MFARGHGLIWSGTEELLKPHVGSAASFNRWKADLCTVDSSGYPVFRLMKDCDACVTCGRMSAAVSGESCETENDKAISPHEPAEVASMTEASGGVLRVGFRKAI